MASTCDYCQKPLSLMRRLRGEQFCSVEHLDLYTAQQAEFALQRLAASVEDKPNTQRPPALLKRISRPVAVPDVPEQQPAPAAPELEHELSQAETQPEEPLRTAPSSQWSVAARHEESSQPEPEYPIAPHVEQGKVSVQILFKPAMLPTPADETISPASPQLPRLAAQPETDWSIPEPAPARAEQPPIAPATPIEVSWTNPALPSRVADPRPAAYSAAEQTIEPGTASLSVPETAPSLPPGKFVDPVIRPAIPAPGMAGDPPSAAEFASAAPIFEQVDRPSGAAFEPPRPAPVRTTKLPVRSGGLAPADPDTAADPIPTFAYTDLVNASSRVSAELPSAPRIPWRPDLAVSFSRFSVLVASAEPEIEYAWPALPSWAFNQALGISKVTLPEAQPRTSFIVVRRESEATWSAPDLAVRPPEFDQAMPRFTKPGVNFGWEFARPKPSSIVSGLAPVQPERSTVSAEVQGLDARPHVRPALSDFARQSVEQWRRPRGGSQTNVLPEANLDSPGVSPRVRELQARVSARFETHGRQLARDWTAPRVDASILDPEIPATSRPAAAHADLRMAPLPAPIPSRLERTGGILIEHSAQAGALKSFNISEPWAIAATQPRPGIVLGPRAALLCQGPAGATLRSISIAPTGADLDYRRYRPVSLTVVPPPRFALSPSRLPEEVRFAALTPFGAYRLPRIRHTGYRMPGPYPKLPRVLPDRYLSVASPEFHEALSEVALTWDYLRFDYGALPVLEGPSDVKIHPADFFAWPTIKTPRTDRILPAREYDSVLGASVGSTPNTRRFGPSRAGLQGRGGSADGLPRIGA